MVCLVNAEEAHRTGGKFIVRFDDNQLSWSFLQDPATVAQYKEGMKRDLEWAGVMVDKYESNSELEPIVRRMLREIYHYDPQPESFSTLPGAELAGCSHHFYPYTERLTAEKVLMDMLEGVNWVIRGMDLISEDCLYRHFCVKFNLPQPRTSYLPRLDCGGEISKTLANYKIEDYRMDGADPQSVVELLRLFCLNGKKWRFKNVKANPQLPYDFNGLVWEKI